MRLDFARHLDYIHINPVKHGLVARVRDWPYSSFHRLVKIGIYPEDWAGDVSMTAGILANGRKVGEKVMGIAALNPSYRLRIADASMTRQPR